MWDVPETILFFSDSVNFRKKIQPSYKGHPIARNLVYKRVINALKSEYEVIVMPELEADDALGIMQQPILVTSYAHLIKTCARSLASSLT